MISYDSFVVDLSSGTALFISVGFTRVDSPTEDAIEFTKSEIGEQPPKLIDFIEAINFMLFYFY